MLQESWSIARAAKAAGLSRTSASRWLRRYRVDGDRQLDDRSCRPLRSPGRTAAKLEAKVLSLRRTRMVAIAIARELGLARSTVGAILRRNGLQRLPPLQAPIPVRRYERESPGELVHLDTKKLGRIRGVGHRIHGDRTRQARGIGWEYAHLAIDDHTRLSYVEVLPDETGESASAFLCRAVHFFERHGVPVQRVLTDNGSAYKSRLFNAACAQRGIAHKWTRPYTPRTNGKAERLVQTLLREWAYQRAYRSSRHRTARLHHYLQHYNHHRPHAGIAYATPAERLRAWHQSA